MKSASLLLLSALLGLSWATPSRAGETWTSDYQAARSLAAKEGKKLLLDFTGSDWCFYCKKLEAEVLATPQFKDYAQNFVLVRLDYPRTKDPAPAEKAQNEALAKQFKIEGFPTVIVVGSDGHELQRAVGYDPGSGPKAYLAQLGAP